jgi:hypothetical protein
VQYFAHIVIVDLLRTEPNYRISANDLLNSDTFKGMELFSPLSNINLQILEKGGAWQLTNCIRKGLPFTIVHFLFSPLLQS